MRALEPLSGGEILDGAFALFRRHFTTLVGVAVVCQGPFQVINLYVTFSGGPVVHPLVFLASFLVSLVGGLLGAAATLRIVSDGYLERETELGHALRFAVSKMRPLLNAGMAKWILIFLAFLLLVVPGFIVACGYAVVAPVVVLEELKRPTDALGRSWELTRGFRGRIFGLGVAIFVIVAAPAWVFAALGAGVPSLLLATQVLAAAFQLVLSPLVACVFTLLYYDLRVRKEAFDLEILSSQLSLATASA